MDLDEIREIMSNKGVDIWSIIETAIEVASIDYSNELLIRRDSIVAKLYHNPCSNCLTNSFAIHHYHVNDINKANHSPYTPVCVNNGGGVNNHVDDVVVNDDVDVDVHVDVDDDVDVDVNDDDGDDDVDVDDEQRRILSIKNQIEDPNQTDDALVDLLQTLADMDITFKALKETDIGRHVNRLRKHPSSDVKRLVKQLVRKWKDLVDDWVKSNTPGEVQSNNLLVDGDSPQQSMSRNQQNGHHSQVPDFAYSPNTQYGSSSYNSESDSRPKAAGGVVPAPRRDTQVKPTKSPVSAPLPSRKKEVAIDPDRLASARRRLQENYQEAQNAKKQRTIQVMDIHEIPKPKNAFFGRNKGGFQRH